MLTLEELSEIYGKKFAYLDFEYRNSEEPVLELVCGVIRGLNLSQPLIKVWLHDSINGEKKFRDLLNDIADTHILVCFGAPAESRSLLSLGVDVRRFDWIDLRTEYQAMANRNNDLMYGKLIKKGTVKKTLPPPLEEKLREPGKSYESIDFNLVECLYRACGIDLGSAEKDRMRDLILGKDEYTEKEMIDIVNYCAIDVEYLPILHKFLVEYKPPNTTVSKSLMTRIHKAALFRGKYSAYTGYSEHIGIPLDTPAIENISRQHGAIKVEMIRESNKVYEFYRYDQKNRAYIQDYSRFKSWIESNGLKDEWPKTDGGKTGRQQYKGDEKTLDKYRFFPAIDAFRGCKKDIGQLQWYRPAALPEFYSAVGSDARLRPWFAPYGTQTARNAPPAKRYIPAQSAWLRALMRPPEGWAITGFDWSSQEFAIAAVLSKDRNMMDAYNSGDPYLHFAKLAKAVPKEGTRQTHGEVRELFKSTCLGLQFGMGVKKLALKLTQDTRKHVSVSEATNLRRQHQDAFPDYWRWCFAVQQRYQSRKPLFTREHWPLWCDNLSLLSAGNFPVQGNGAATAHLAFIKAIDRGLDVIITLHDYLGIIHREGDTESVRILKECMTEAVEEMLQGAIHIRLDAKTVTHTNVWVEPKGRRMFEKMAPYLYKGLDDSPLCGIDDLLNGF